MGRVTEIRDAYHFHCPKCGCEPGHLCLDREGNPWYHKVHRARWDWAFAYHAGFDHAMDTGAAS